MGVKSSPAPAPAPDYKGAAEATAASQRTSQYTPYGSLVYNNELTPEGEVKRDASGNPMWRSDITLVPEAQQTLDTQLRLSKEMGDVTTGALGDVRSTYANPMDISSVPEIADKAYGAMTSRLDPQWRQAETSAETKLINQGLRPGDEAYDNAMRVFNQAKNDAYQQANLGAIQTMPQTYQLATSTYNQPLNIFNALRTGAQVQNPTFNAGGAGTNYLGAAQAQGQYDQGLYNAKVGQQNALMGGLFNLGSAAIPFMF